MAKGVSTVTQSEELFDCLPAIRAAFHFTKVKKNSIYKNIFFQHRYFLTTVLMKRKRLREKQKKKKKKGFVEFSDQVKGFICISLIVIHVLML